MVATDLDAALAEALACADSCRSIRHEIATHISLAESDDGAGGAALHATAGCQWSSEPPVAPQQTMERSHVSSKRDPVKTHDRLEPEPEMGGQVAACVAAGSAAAKLEQHLARRERVYDSLKVKELQILIEGRGEAPAMSSSGPLRVALIKQAKALAPATLAGAPRTAVAPAWLQRTSLLLGDSALTGLAAARVLVVGVGGVGSWCAEFLVRGGVGHLTIIDDDDVDPTNRNRYDADRQFLIALLYM